MQKKLHIKLTKLKNTIHLVATAGEINVYDIEIKDFQWKALVNTISVLFDTHKEEYSLTTIVLENALDNKTEISEVWLN